VNQGRKTTGLIEDSRVARKAVQFLNSNLWKVEMNSFILKSILLCLFMVSVHSRAFAVTTYIGDVDSFGHPDVSSLIGADGTAADRDGNGILESGDVLPDIDEDGYVWLKENVIGDVYDNRSIVEKSALTDERWTDVVLTSYFVDYTIGNETHNGPGFPDDASFTFNFALPQIGAPDYEMNHFVSFVYGDYDVDPMYAVVEGETVQLNGNYDAGLDGYIWRAYAPVTWEQMLDGVVTIQIDAPNEPYVLFDYVLLDVDPIQTPTVPVPAAIWLLGSGLLGLVGIKRRFQK
jgi:hypothetical protein